MKSDVEIKRKRVVEGSALQSAPLKRRERPKAKTPAEKLAAEQEKARSLFYRPVKDREDWLACWADGNPPRQFGSTTGAVMVAIGQALQEPGIEFEMVPARGHGDNVRTQKYHAERAIRLINHLGLMGLVLIQKSGKILIKSENFGYVPHDD